MTNKQRTAAWILAFIVALVAAFAIYTVLSNRQGKPSNLSAGSSQGDGATDTRPAPDFTVYDQSGTEVTLADFTGKPIVVNFWASWCGPCQEEMPAFNDAYDTAGEDITFLMINATDGSRETKESATDFVLENQYTFPIYFDTTGSAQTAFGVTGYPETFFIDTNGDIVAQAQGALTPEDLAAGIEMIAP